MVSLEYHVKCKNCGVIGKYREAEKAEAAKNRHIESKRHPTWVNKVPIQVVV